MPLTEPLQTQSRPLVVSAAEAKRANAAHVRQQKLEKRALQKAEAYSSADGYTASSTSVLPDRFAPSGLKTPPPSNASGAFF